MSKSICVIGVARMEIVLRAAQLAGPGETVLGLELVESPGGRGLAQAVAASRLGAKVGFVGRLGDDARGSDLRGALATAGVDLQHTQSSAGAASGVALLQVLPDGRVASTLVPGAEAHLCVEDVDGAAQSIRAADVLLLQAEAPAAVNRRAIEIADGSTPVVLHAAPAGALEAELLAGVDLLVASRAQACALLGDGGGEISPAGLARRLACLGPQRVVLQLGAEGALHIHGTELSSQERWGVAAIDRLGCEDAFVAALAVQRAEGARIKDALRLASVAAGLAGATSAGLAALPMRDKVEAALREWLGS